jgi:thymidine phosphorylase
MAGVRQDGRTLATQTLDSGRALRKFEAICEAQGGRRTPPQAEYREPILAVADGVIASIDTRKLARLGKLAGAPRAPAAGVDMHVRTGRTVARGEPLLTVHAQSPGELHYALEYFARQPDLIVVKAE